MSLDAQERRFLIEMHGDVKSLITEMRANTEATKSIDGRMRAVEVKQGEQDVRISVAQKDIGALWRVSRPRREQDEQGGKGGILRTALECVAALPDYWHALLVLCSLVAGATTGLALVLHAAGH